MTELTLLIIKNSFRTQSVTEKDHLNYEELYSTISKLNATAFDEETYEQIWDQCKLNSKGEVRISDFVEYLLKAEQLLIEKQQENASDIAKLENDKKGKLTEFSEQRQYKDEMETLIQEKDAIKNSLEIIRKPFLAAAQNNVRSTLTNNLPVNPELQPPIDKEDIVNQLFEYDSSETAGVLSTICYITGILTLLTWLESFFICQFLNLVAYTLILSQFALQVISRKIIKFNLLLLTFCTVFDILWLTIQTSKTWYLPENYELPGMVSNYLKFSIILMIICVGLRVGLFYFYLSQFHLDQFQVYPISLLGKEINIQIEAEPYSSNKNPFSFLLQPYFNRSSNQSEPIQ